MLLMSPIINGSNMIAEAHKLATHLVAQAFGLVRTPNTIELRERRVNERWCEETFHHLATSLPTRAPRASKSLSSPVDLHFPYRRYIRRPARIKATVSGSGPG